MTITNVQVDIANASVSVTFSDGTSQVVTAPLVPEVQGVSLEDLQKEQVDVVAEVVTPPVVEAAPVTPTE